MKHRWRNNEPLVQLPRAARKGRKLPAIRLTSRRLLPSASHNAIVTCCSEPPLTRSNHPTNFSEETPDVIEALQGIADVLHTMTELVSYYPALTPLFVRYHQQTKNTKSALGHVMTARDASSLADKQNLALSSSNKSLTSFVLEKLHTAGAGSNARVRTSNTPNQQQPA